VFALFLEVVVAQNGIRCQSYVTFYMALRPNVSQFVILLCLMPGDSTRQGNCPFLLLTFLWQSKSTNGRPKAVIFNLPS
jgi:hypothetical protein